MTRRRRAARELSRTRAKLAGVRAALALNAGRDRPPDGWRYDLEDAELECAELELVQREATLAAELSALPPARVGRYALAGGSYLAYAVVVALTVRAAVLAWLAWG